MHYKTTKLPSKKFFSLQALGIVNLLISSISLSSCSDDSSNDTPPVIGGMEEGGFWTLEDGRETPLHNRVIVMPADTDTLTVTIYSHGWRASSVYQMKSSGNLSATLLDTDQSSACDSTKTISGAYNDNTSVTYTYRQRLRITAAPAVESDPSDFIELRAQANYFDGFYSDFRITRGK